jgi:hypothetical protein
VLMKIFVTWAVLAAICFGGSRAWAQLQVAPPDTPQRVFGGSTQTISVRWHNAGTAVIETGIRTRTMQLSSATAAPIDEALWKTLRVLPGQTVIETAALAFPAVKGETRFLVQWVGRTNEILGATEVRVYPTNLLAELGPLVGHDDGALGIFDPQNQLKPLLRSLKVDFVDLENAVLEDFRGKLAIIGPFEAKASSDPMLTRKVQKLSENKVAVVWIQPPRASSDIPVPSFYFVPGGETAVVVAQPQVAADLPKNPQSQLNLIYFCKLALHPQPLALPDTSLQP